MVELMTHSNAASLKAVVTGAADGIGADCARLLSRRGAQLVLADIDKVPLARLANELGAHAFACDVLAEQSVGQLVQFLTENLPTADVLVNAAGKGYVRSLGMMRVSRSFAAAAAPAATIVNIGAHSVGPEQFGHAGSPKAFRRLSEGLGAVLRDRGIKVVTLGSLSGTAELERIIAALFRTGQAPEHDAPRRASR